MLTPDMKRKYKEQFNLGVNLESKRARNLLDEMLKLDEQLFDFVKVARAKFHKTNIGVSMPMILAKAQSIAAALNLKTKISGVEKDWKPTGGWYSRFIKRYQLGAISLHGEANDVNLDDVEPKMEKIRQTLRRYDLDCIFNVVRRR